MNHFKSSPLLPQFNNKNKTKKKGKVQRDSKQHQILVANPFLQNQQQNFLPPILKQQVQRLDFISPNQIQKMTFQHPHISRRSSTFNRNLQAMQLAAKKQEQMMSFWGRKQQKQEIQQTGMQQQNQMSIQNIDDVSIGMQHSFFRLDEPRDELDFEMMMDQQPGMIFYSQAEIVEPLIQEDYGIYFDV